MPRHHCGTVVTSAVVMVPPKSPAFFNSKDDTPDRSDEVSVGWPMLEDGAELVCYPLTSAVQVTECLSQYDSFVEAASCVEGTDR